MTADHTRARVIAPPGPCLTRAACVQRVLAVHRQGKESKKAKKKSAGKVPRFTLCLMLQV